MTSHPIPYAHAGFGCVRPYLHGPVKLLDFITQVFNAEEIERHVYGPAKFHVELRIADSMVIVEAGDVDYGSDWPPNSIYVYVPDVDATYALALKHGGASVAACEDKPYGERQCGFKDMAGNMWWVATALQATRAS